MGNIGYRIRNCFTLANIAALLFGVGGAMIGVFGPRVLANVSQETAVICFWVGIALIALGLAMVVWRYIKNPIEKRQKIFSIISVLEEMYKRLEILVNEEKNKEIDWGKVRETTDKITKLVQLTVPQVSSVDEAREAVEKAEKKISNIFGGDAELSEKVRRVLEISRLIDRGGFGLKERRKRDKKYSKLLRAVDRYYSENEGFIDDELSGLIRSCVEFNESGANALLYVERANIPLDFATVLGIPNILTPSLEAGIEGFSDDVREVARMIRVKVGDKIKKLVKGNGN